MEDFSPLLPLSEGLDLTAPKDRRTFISNVVKHLEDLQGKTDFNDWTDHGFVAGLYVRRFRMPKGWVVVGKIHLHECFSTILTGRILEFTQDGLVERRGGDVFSSPAGTQRLLLPLEDTVWMTVHPNPDNIKDIELLENHYVTTDNGDNRLPWNKE